MRLVGAIAAAGATLLLSAAASAVPFTGTYVIDAFEETDNDGLDIFTADLAPQPFNLDLSVGVSQTIDLFRIWTDETALNGDDIDPDPITATFSFTAPPPPFGGPVGGSTVGATIFIASGGTVNWNDPVDIAFGGLGDGLLRIDLSDEIFNPGAFFNLTPGYDHGATVTATFTLVREASPVPVPAPLALISVGLLGIGLSARRRRKAA